MVSTLNVQPRYFLTLKPCLNLMKSIPRRRTGGLPLEVDRTGSLPVVCHTFREEKETSARIRIISARRATNNEAKQYEGR